MRFAKDMPREALASPETLEIITRNQYFALSYRDYRYVRRNPDSSRDCDNDDSINDD